MKVQKTPNSALHAKVVDVDLSQPLPDGAFAAIERALAENGVLSFPGQKLTPPQFRAFAQLFGTLETNVANLFHEPGIPEMMIISNVMENGKPIGLQEAGQGWHTDLSYARTVGYTTSLYAIEIPQRDGKALGATEFCSMHAAYEALPEELKRRLEGKTVLHDFNKFWEMMRSERGSKRPVLTEAQRQARPPTSHPVFLTHPVTKRKVLYANPGYAIRINEMSPAESEEVLSLLFEHQTQPRFKYQHSWTVGDVLMWDNIGTIHNAVPDYGPNDRRLLKRCQTLATRFSIEQVAA